MPDETPYPRFASRGRAYVYVLPCRDEDLLKVGFSREPFTRFSTLHRRFFDFFDLERGFLLDTGRVADARRVERQLIEALAEHRAMAPLVVPRSAAGHTEWYRGAAQRAGELIGEIAQAHALPLQAIQPWLTSHLGERADLLHDWSQRLHDTLEWARHNAPDDPAAAGMRRALLDTLDLFAAAGLDPAGLVPRTVANWYRDGDHRRLFPD